MSAKAPSQREQQRRDTQRAAFDADAAAKQRQEAQVTINGKVYHRRVKNNQVSREARDVARRQERALIRAEQGRKRLLEMDDDSDLDAFEQLEDEIDSHDDAALEAAYDLAVLLLRDEDGNSPPVEELKEHVDVEDLRYLTRLGGGEPAEGPTETASSSTP